MKEYKLGPSCHAVVEDGDITKVNVDVIVNAANEWMLGGGGVDGVIHRAAGPELVEACREVPEVRPDVRCPRGEARITPGFNLPAKFVIHTVGPVYQSAEKSAPVLAAAYASSCRLANEYGVGSIAFPAISCGVYGYPLAEASRIAVQTVRDHVGELSVVRFVMFGYEAYTAWLDAAEEVLR